MNKIILALCFVAIVNCENETYKDIIGKLSNLLTEHKDGCLKKSQAQPELVEQHLSGMEVTITEELKCYIECALSQGKIINEDFKLDSDKLKIVLPSESASFADEIINKCENGGSLSNCEKAYQIQKCMYLELKTKFDV